MGWIGPDVILNALATALHRSIYTVPSIHRLWLGLLPLAFFSQCQCRPSRVLSPLVFFPISTHFTAPPKISSAFIVLQLGSFHRLSRVEPWDSRIFSRLIILKNPIKLITKISIIKPYPICNCYKWFDLNCSYGDM